VIHGERVIDAGPALAYPIPMGGRIEEGYRLKLRELLARVRPRRLEFGVELILRRARELAEREAIPAAQALARLYEFTRWRVHRRLEVTGDCAVRTPLPEEPRFVCDGSLGGLVRWLRAAGYAAGGPAPQDGQASGDVLVTTSHLALQLARGWPAVVWVPSGMTPASQAGVVLRDLGLPLRAPRCMHCGARPEAVTKDSVRERIPPRTALWKDEYSLCPGCGRLLWEGTHWERIRAALERERPAPADPGRP
jgi:uncharacterized protein